MTERSLPPNLPAVSNFVTVLLAIAGDVEQNPGPSERSSMGSVNNLYTEIRRESSATDVTGGIIKTALVFVTIYIREECSHPSPRVKS